jgi:hypothetical protein
MRYLTYIILTVIVMFLLSDYANADELLIHDLGNGFSLLADDTDVRLCTRIQSYIVCN